MKNYILILLITLTACSSQSERKVMSLNGEWQVSESITPDYLPESYSHTVQVPGLVDLATPAFDSVYSKSPLRDYFWYKKEIKVEGKVPPVAIIKTHKIAYGQKVFVNGQAVGEKLYSYTPEFYDVAGYLKGNNEPNEIVIRVGANTDILPDTIPYGKDNEKIRYTPGIYDEVELILTDYPYVENVQIVPEIETNTVRVVAYLISDQDKNVQLKYELSEFKSGAAVKNGKSRSKLLKANQLDTLDFRVPIADCQLWSPENPFLYSIHLSTGSDTKNVRFGMREFKFDPEKKVGMLNGKPYYMRGTNLALHRFMDDTVRQDLPWNRDWVIKMHQKFKDLHWNTYRYHVGFAPHFWYDIADEMGFLVADEYAFWGIFLDDTSRVNTGQHERYTASTLVTEYTDWMRERWNHPSVVIWDAQNETLWQEVGKAINQVRHLDLSNRPWDNGFSAPMSPTDCIESHPYLFLHPYFLGDDQVSRKGMLYDVLAGEYIETFNDPNEYQPPISRDRWPNAIINNEYAWVWLTRDGNPTPLTECVYSRLPELDTPEKRLEWKARTLAVKTEYWRCHRQMAGVLHFCALTNSTNAMTGDDWKDVKNLILHKPFEKHARSAFAPVGLMIDWWINHAKAEEKKSVSVFAINDLYETYSGDLKFQILKNEKIVSESTKSISIDEVGRTITDFDIEMPKETGDYQLKASIDFNGEEVFSIRDVKVD
ncbi:glycoside hydrolase family 2 TIM barrel-domain containing protein [Sunxiuqinia indica]|uniref:glycoside hydrolase family 2 TIM barrel-domain containing protein n=1 Tax=Sunxiuqinia indica TaxID=2692584 RepID=UPI00135BCC63|nr:glycoside hydrolase family 2 TIM barrel-domain containing protein [Sunxiuqinia indica]